MFYPKVAEDFTHALAQAQNMRFAPLRQEILFVKAYLLTAEGQPEEILEHNRKMVYVLENQLHACEHEDFESSAFWAEQQARLETQAEKLVIKYELFIQLELN